MKSDPRLSQLGLLLLSPILLIGCSFPFSQSVSEPATDFSSFDSSASMAIITDVEVTTSGDRYQFSVTIESPDTGCNQYANWWEILTEDGTLVYRRILAHSHVNEQPFQRSGNAIALDPTEPVIVRAHMHPHGYGTQAMQGTIETGFESITLPDSFAADVSAVEPLPTACAF